MNSGDRLHVLLVSTWYPAHDKPFDGLFVRDQARAVSLYCEVTVVSPTAAGMPRDSADGQLRVLRVLPNGAGLMANIRRFLVIAAVVRQLRREGRGPDLIHAHVYYTAFLAVLVGRLYGVPVVVSEHLSDIIEGLLSRFHAAFARFTFRSAAVVCPVSSVLKRSLAVLEPRGRYIVVGNSVDVEAFASPTFRARACTRPSLLTVGGLFKYKGIPYLLEALRVLLGNHPNARLEIAGDGPDRDELEAMAEGLPVVFLGPRSRSEVAALMRKADVLVMPSIVETFGIAPLEALAAGLPVVATSAFPTADVISELGGVIVPPRDSPALADAISRLVGGRSHAQDNAAAEIAGRFGLETSGRRWRVIYDGVIHGAS